MEFSKSILIVAVLVFIGSMFGGGGVGYAADKVVREKQTDKPAIVFLVAGQSNAGGCGVISPEVHEKLGYYEIRPLVPGSTAREIGLSTDAADYTHSYIWVPGKGFERVNPNANLWPGKPDKPAHGMELPAIAELEKRFPENDIYVVKYGPGSTNLYDDWSPQRTDGKYAVWLGYYRKAMAQLTDEYPELRVVGLYWDQGESDGKENMANDYETNLTHFIAAVRRDTGMPRLKIFIRKHIFNWPNIDAVIKAQEKVVENDSRCYLLDIDLGDRKANYESWAYSPNNGHVSSKGFVELTRRLFDGPLLNATIASFDLYEGSGKMTSAKILRDTADTACLYHFDTSFVWVDSVANREHLLTPDDDSANPDRNRNALMNYYGDEPGGSSITTGSQGLSGTDGDEALRVSTTPESSNNCYAVLKWLFDGDPYEDLPSLTEPWDDFENYVRVEFWVKPLAKSAADGDPNTQRLTRVSGAWEMNLAVDPETGNRGLQLVLWSDVTHQRMEPIEGSRALWIGDFFEPKSLGRWRHIIFKYDCRKVTFTVDEIARTATMPADMWRRKGTSWWFGCDKGNVGVNALFDEAQMIIRRHHGM